MQYLTLIKSIPKEWTLLLKIKSKPLERLEQKITKAQKRQVQYMYNLLQARTPNPSTNCRSKWEIELDEEISDVMWVKNTTQLNKLTLSTKLRSFQYRLTNRALVTNIQLCRWAIKTSPKCHFCGLYDESYTHLLVHCHIVKRSIWFLLTKWLDYFCNINLDVSAQQIIFNEYKEAFALMVNMIILIAKQYIYAKKCLNQKLCFVKLIENITQMKNLEGFIAKRNKNIEKHERKWCMYDRI